MSEMKRSMEDQEAADDTVVLLVGGISYVLPMSILTKYPDSYFANLIKPKWRSSAREPIVIEREGSIFQYVYDFLRYGFLPRNAKGKLLLDQDTRAAIRVEADYFQLRQLVTECDSQDSHMCSEAVSQMAVYSEVVSYLEDAKYDRKLKSTWTIPHHVKEFGEEDPDDEEDVSEENERKDQEYRGLLQNVSAPFCASGKLSEESVRVHDKVYKSSNMEKLNLEELIAEATLSPFGKGSETVIDTNVRHSYEIDLSKSHLYGITSSIDLTAFASKGSEIELRPYKLVIYKEGGHFHAHRDTVRGENHIGTLVIILNSEYTGGELEVSHGGRTETVTGAYSWVAMYGDCLHKINPVTSGTRASLIYDIYQKRKTRSPWESHDSKEDSVWGSSRATLPISSIPRGVNETQRQAVIAGMHEQLQGFDSAAICLQHLYPACQANPDFLKGGDLLLFDILQTDFKLAIIPATIYRRSMTRYSDARSVCTVKPFYNELLPAEDRALAQTAALLRTKVILVDALAAHHTIKSEEVDYTGNESQGEETSYLVAMLQVCRK